MMFHACVYNNIVLLGHAKVLYVYSTYNIYKCMHVKGIVHQTNNVETTGKW